MNPLPKMEVVAPATTMEACSILEEHGEKARVVAGGTDLLVACKLRNVRPSLLVSLKKILVLKGIDVTKPEGVRIGAMTRLGDLIHDPAILTHYPALAQAAALVGATQLQWMGTLGGNLCLNSRCMYYNQSHLWRKSRPPCLKMGGDVCHVVPTGKSCYAIFSGDLAPALIALDARVKVVSKAGERTQPIGKLYTGDGKVPVALRPGEILTDVIVPLPQGREGSVYLKYRPRRSIDFPLASVAVRMRPGESGICRDCKIVVNAVGSAPAEIPEAEELLRGKVLTRTLMDQAAAMAVKAAHPVANAAGVSPSYRRKMVGLLTERALVALSNNPGIL